MYIHREYLQKLGGHDAKIGTYIKHGSLRKIRRQLRQDVAEVCRCAAAWAIAEVEKPESYLLKKCLNNLSESLFHWCAEIRRAM